jgi:ribosomal-protein-alanine N-acetyltransferase
MNLHLTTDRLCLTPLTESDLDFSLEMYTNPLVVKYLGGLMSETEIKRVFPNWIKRGGNGCIGIWCISDCDSGEKYGSAILLPLPIDLDDTDFSLVVPGRMPDAEIEIGYSLKPSAWGRGYATEACKRLLQFAFEEAELNEIAATFDDGHFRSQNVLEKSGLRDHGRMKCYGEDSIIYRMTRDEWLLLQN